MTNAAFLPLTRPALPHTGPTPRVDWIGLDGRHCSPFCHQLQHKTRGSRVHDAGPGCEKNKALPGETGFAFLDALREVHLHFCAGKREIKVLKLVEKFDRFSDLFTISIVQANAVLRRTEKQSLQCG